ncbi:hypothetical protein MD484_g2599, partial [Candolleomyces efflorescens]
MATATTTSTVIATTAVGRLEALQNPIPEPGDDEVLIKVEYATLTPFDVYVVDQGFFVQYPQVVGGNSGGTVVKFGANVKDLEVGDQVVAFPIPTKGLQQYSLHRRSVLAKVPSNTSLVQATTAPDNFVTAFYTLFNRLGLPLPTSFPATSPPENATSPILVYGAGATSGQYAVELLRLAGYTNVIAVASKKHEAYLKELGASSVVDYKSPTFVEDVKVLSAHDGGIERVVDCVSLTDSFTAISKIVSPTGTVAWLAPFKRGLVEGLNGESVELFSQLPEDAKAIFKESVKLEGVFTFQYQTDERLANTLMPTTLPKLLSENLIKPNRFKLLDHADLLTRTKDALELLRQNKVSGEKLVVKISD